MTHESDIDQPTVKRTAKRARTAKRTYQTLPTRLEFLRNQIERIAHGRRWRLWQERPTDYLFVIGQNDIHAVPKA